MTGWLKLPVPRPGARCGDHVLSAVRLRWLYARVDVIEAARGPLLIELELIEPELFCTLAPERVRYRADALLA